MMTLCQPCARACHIKTATSSDPSLIVREGCGVSGVSIVLASSGTAAVRNPFLGISAPFLSVWEYIVFSPPALDMDIQCRQLN